MQEVQVDIVRLQSLEAFIEVSSHRFWCKTRHPGTSKYILAVHSRMTALGDQEHLIASSGFLNPLTQRFFAIAKTINVRCINTVSTCFQKSVEQLRGAVISIW